MMLAAAPEAPVTYPEVRAIPAEPVVAAPEVPGPTEERPGRGRTDYLRKRGAALVAHAGLVKINRLRAGERMPITTQFADSHYRIPVNGSWRRPGALRLPFIVKGSIPLFRWPWLPEDTHRKLLPGHCGANR